MKTGSILRIGIMSLVATIFVLPSCHRKTAEESLREWVQGVGERVEKKDARGLLDRIGEDYADSEGRSRQETAAMVESYFEKYRGIVVHVLACRIQIASPESAFVEVDVAVSSGAAEALRRLIRFSGECYRFRCRLRRAKGGWLATYAEWEPVDSENLFPDSVQMLKEIFS